MTAAAPNRRLCMAALLVLCAAMVCVPRSAHAQGRASFSVTRSMTSPQLEGKQVGMNPYEVPPGCSDVGVCVPFTFTLPNRTLWYWCGWSSTERTDYVIRASGNIAAQIMRRNELEDCALPKLSSMGGCQAIFGSGCGGGPNCTMRVLALVYYDEVCLVIANNNAARSATVNVQVFQYYDSPRYYGMIFTIILAILMIGGVTTYIAWTCYKEITSPTDRLHELRSFEAQLQRQETTLGSSSDSRAEADRDVSDPGSFQGRVKTALSKAKNLVLRSKGPAQA